MASNADIYTAARKGLVEYRSIFLPAPDDVSPAKFHYDWSKELLTGEGHAAFEGFRESGKGSLILRAFPLYALTFPSEKWKYIVILKSNMAQARKALRNITNEFVNNPLINARLIKVVKNTADVFEVVLDTGRGEQTILIEAYGKGASIRGLNNKDVRPSLILIDDCQDSADLLSEVVPEQDWDWFLSDVMFLGASARIFMIGNNLGERCIIERIGRNCESMGFKFKRIPCANPDFTVSTWSEKQSIEEIKRERDDYEAIGKLDVWLREKMCMAVSDETRLFKDSMYRHYPASLKDSIAREGEVLAALDPASSSRKDSCFRAIVVGSLMPDGHWYILDVPYGRWDSVELMAKMFEVVRKWGIKDFGVEKGQYQQFLEPVLYREMTLKRLRFNITPMEHGKIGSKLERIKMLQPYFKSGSIWFPEVAEWLTETKNELAGVTRDELKSEYVDLIDAMAMLCTQMRAFSARTEITDSKKRYNFGRQVEYEFRPETV
jgi:predicted phage terminase large subunit-like protein